MLLAVLLARTLLVASFIVIIVSGTIVATLVGTALQACTKTLGTETALLLIVATIEASLVIKGTRLMNTWTWRTSGLVTLITTLLGGCVLLLGRLLFIFLLVFEIHNITVFLAESLTALFVLII